MATGTRFAANNAGSIDQSFGSEGLALGQTEDLANQANLTTRLALTAATTFDGVLTDPTPAQFVNSLLETSGGAWAITTPSAAQIVAVMPNVQVGSSFDVIVVNGAGGNITWVAGAGVTLAGTTTAAANTSQFYKGVVTNATAGAEAVRIVGILKTAS